MLISRKAVVGNRVAVLHQGRFVSGTVQAFKSFGCVREEDIYVVRFDDNTVTECFSKNMIGTNYKPTSGLWMQPFQKVYTTHNGREVSGFIQHYKDDQIFISIPGASEEKEVISKKPDEVRLYDSRRSQRVPNTSPVDQANPADDSNVSMGRTVSASIEVPKATQRIRRTSEEPTMNELMAAMVLSSLSCSPVFHNQPKAESSPRSYDSSGVESWTHDSKHTSPARHPSSINTSAGVQSSDSEGKGRDEGDAETAENQRSRTPEDMIDTDSGTILLPESSSTPTKSHQTKTVQMEEDYPDEPQDLSVPKVRVEEPARPRSRPSIPSSYTDVGKLDVVMENEEQQKSQQPSLAITMAMPITIPQILPYYVRPGLFPHPFFGSLPAEFRLHLPSTPPIRSPEIGSSAPGVMDSKLHRYSHRAVPYQKYNDDSSVASPSGSSPSPQQVYGSAPATYYHLPKSPIPVSSLSFSPSHHRKHTRSPLANKPQPVQQTTSQPVHATPVAVPTSTVGYPVLQSLPFANPSVAESAIPKAFSWQGTTQPPFLTKPVQPRPQLQQASGKQNFNVSPKPIPPGRKVRGDGKKCRKVYGMDHRDMWCTACRWKKACQRFPD